MIVPWCYATMVATAAEEMTATINEIAQKAEKARSISDQAVDEAQETSGRMDGLGHAAQGIGKVVETITEISEPVNLLALNATITQDIAGVNQNAANFANGSDQMREKAEKLKRMASERNGIVSGFKV